MIIAVPSLNRPKNSTHEILKQLTRHEVYFVVRESQKHLYEVEGYTNLLSFPDQEIDDIGKTRKKIVEHFSNICDIITIMDDDIKLLCFNKNQKALKTTEYDEWFDQLEWYFKYACSIDKNVYGGCPQWASYAFANFMDGVMLCAGKQIQIVILNLKRMKDNNLNYASWYDHYSEDSQLVLEAANKGLYPCLLSKLSFAAGQSEDINFDLNLEERINKIIEKLPEIDQRGIFKVKNSIYKKNGKQKTFYFDFRKLRKLLNITNYKIEVNYEKIHR